MEEGYPSIQGEVFALHLIDARRHRRLKTWTSGQLTDLMRSIGGRRAKVEELLVQWAPDGSKLAVAGEAGLVIFDLVA